ncbi:hypothetical protein EJB05_39019, partial [Eragrostis curvula]
MAAPPSPRPPKPHSGGGDAPLSLFLDTDLGTRLALLVAPDTTIRRLKCMPLTPPSSPSPSSRTAATGTDSCVVLCAAQVAEEHAAAFPELGPVAVKSFQVHRKGALYHLSESMTVTSAFTRVKGGYFLHVKMAEAAASMHCRQGVLQIDGRKTSEGHTGIHVEKHVRELPAATLEKANDTLAHGLGVLDDGLLPPSSELNAETKKNETILASDADIDKSSKQANVSHVVDADAKYLLHGSQDYNIDGVVADDKQIRIEEGMLGQTHAMDDLSQGKEYKNAKRTGSIHLSSTDPRIPNESDGRDITKSSTAQLETNPTHGELLNTSFGQEVNDNIPEDSLQIENASTVGKKKRRKRRQLTHSKTDSAQETTKFPAGAVELSKSGDDAYEVELTKRDGSKARSSVLMLSSKPDDEGQGGKHIQFVNDAQTSTDLTSEQGNSDHVHNGDIHPSIVDTIDSTAEVPAIREKIVEGSNDPWDEGEKHEEAKKHEYNEENHDGGVAGTSNVEKDGKSTDASEKRPTIDNVSQENKRRKAKKVNSVDMASVGTADDKEMLGHPENAGNSDKVYTEREIVHGSSVGPVSDNVQHGESNVIENRKGDGKRKRKRRRQSESSKGADPNQDQAKSSEHVTKGSSMQHTNFAPLDAQQTQGNLEGARVSDHTNSAPLDAQQTQGYRGQFSESLDMAAANTIDEVLADLKSQDSLNNYLSEDVPTGLIHLDSNRNALELPESIVDKVGNDVALPPKYPESMDSDAPVRSPSHKKPKGKQLKLLSTMIDSSHHSHDMPEEDANTELKESDALRFSGKTGDLKDVLTGDVAMQADDKAKGTKRQRKKVKKVPTDNGGTTQFEDEQVNQVAKEELKEVDAARHADQKGKRAPKTRAPKIQEINHSTHTAKDSHDENAVDIIRTRDNENAVEITGTRDNENAAGYPTEPPVVQKDATALKSASPNGTNARKKRKKSLKTELRSEDFAMEHDPSADLASCGAENGLVSPKNSADTVEPNHHIMVHPASDEINFFEHFSSGKRNDQLVSAENKQNNEDENIREVTTKKKKKKQHTGSTEPKNLLESLPAEKTSLTDHFGANEVVVPSAEEWQGEHDNVKGGKEKKKRKRKPNSEGPAAEKENLDGDHQGSGIGTQDSLHSVVQKGRMGQNDGNENNKVTQNVTIMQQEPEYGTCDRTVDKKLRQDDVDSQNNLPISKDNASISEVQKSTQKKAHAKSSKHDQNVSNIVKSFSMSPQASSDSAECTPQIAKRYRVAVRKVPKTRYEQTNAKSKKESRKVGSAAIFSDAISEESDDAMDTKSEKAALEASFDNSSTSADSGGNLNEVVSHGIGVSSAAFDESELPDDDGALSLSQKSLRGLHFGSILRGSSSYKKAKQKQDELLDDDTEVPDSQPADGLWG